MWSLAPRLLRAFDPETAHHLTLKGLQLGLHPRFSQPDAAPAVTLFGKLRVWDTEHNNGVLIYLLLAEHAIEIVADRGIDARVIDDDWRAMAQRMGAAFREVRFEDGLTQALEEMSALLVEHFPLRDDEPDRNELPDEPVVL